MAQPRILLVASDPVQAQLLAQLIEQLGFQTLGPVASAAEALTLCQRTWPELAILDVHLAGATDGIELATQLRSLSSLPLIFLSEAEDVATRERMIQAHPVALLPKPYLPEALEHLIRQGLALGQVAPARPALAPPAARLPAPLIAGQLEMVPPLRPFMFVREHSTLVRVLLADLVGVHMNEQCAELLLASGRRLLVRIPLAALQALLPPLDFVQSHRSWIINLHYIEEVALTQNVVRLLGGVEAAMGRAYRSQLLQCLPVLGQLT